MGLDMYLTKKTYVKNWDHMSKKEKHQITIKKGEKNTNIKPERISYITEQVMYWRKANQIHNWFKNLDSFSEDTQEGDVSVEDLKKLLETVNKVLKNSKLVKGKIKNGQTSTKDGWEDIMEDGEYIEDPSTAKKLLPTSEGFFFGSQDYDQYYYKNLKDTQKELTELLKENNDNADFYYLASW
ncbi:MAG: hypothetical protein HQ536_05195 [Parcubacteria group bacterium]|nr:hypothetical protein [Parcubacteria group bacterium]